MTARTDHGGEPGVFCAAVEACALSTGTEWRVLRLATMHAAVCVRALCHVRALARTPSYAISNLCIYHARVTMSCAHVRVHRSGFIKYHQTKQKSFILL